MMESLFGLLLVGYIVYAVFSRLLSISPGIANGEERLRALEAELRELKNRLSRLEAKGAAPDIASTGWTDSVAQKASETAPSMSEQATEIFQSAAVFSESAPNEGMELALTAASSQPLTSCTVDPASLSPSSDKSAPQEIYPSDPVSKIFTAAKNWLFGGNTMVRPGIVILFIGISFLLKYAAEHSYVPIELRIAAIELFGIALLALGWRMRTSRSEYAWALQGGGIGVLYLTTFAAYKLYQLISPGAVFTLLLVIAALSATIAVLQSALSMAVLGFTGGFLAPIFTSTGHGSHIGLFSYYLVLNLAIAAIAYYKSWRPLNVLGFVFTFVIGTLWGAQNYLPEHFGTTEPFLVIHFALFNVIATLYAHRQATKASDYVDSTLIFGTPLVGFSLQYALLKDSHFGLAYSALALGIFYLSLAWWLFNRKRDTLVFLAECYLALGIGFATLTIPLALDGRWTSAAWAVEGAGLVWAGLRQQRNLPLIAGLMLQLFGAGAFCAGWGLTGHSGISQQNMFLGVAFIALSGWACGALINAYRAKELSTVIGFLAVWGWLWWVGAGLTAIDQFLPPRWFVHAALLFVTITSALLPFVARAANWPTLGKLTGLLLPVMTVVTLIDCLEGHPFANYGGIIWPLAFAACMVLLNRNQFPKGVGFRVPLVWLAALLGVKEWRNQLLIYVNESVVWHDIGWAVVPTLIVGAICRWQRQNAESSDCDALQSAKTWLWYGCAPLMAFLVLWFVYASLHSSGNAAPLPYVPLLNPLDIALTAVLLLLLVWRRASKPFNKRLTAWIPVVSGLMGFALANGMLLRSLHHWLGTPFEWMALFNYPQVQMAFTFLWGIAAFLLMWLAHYRKQRRLWLIGAGLMGLVVAKIFLLDMAQSGSIERIISFIGAGVLLLVMGYFAPLPPVSVQPEFKEPT